MKKEIKHFLSLDKTIDDVQSGLIKNSSLRKYFENIIRRAGEIWGRILRDLSMRTSEE